MNYRKVRSAYFKEEEEEKKNEELAEVLEEEKKKLKLFEKENAAWLKPKGKFGSNKHRSEAKNSSSKAKTKPQRRF